MQLLTAVLVLIASSSAAAKSDNGLIQAKVAVVGGVCMQRICRSAEDRHGCAFWHRSGEERGACRPDIQLHVPPASAQHHRKCTVCGVSPHVHILRRRVSQRGIASRETQQTQTLDYPRFPPRTQPTFCAVAGDAAGSEHMPRVPTVEEITRRRRQAIN